MAFSPVCVFLLSVGIVVTVGFTTYVCFGRDCIGGSGSRCPCCEKPGARTFDEKMGTLSTLFSDLAMTLCKEPAGDADQEGGPLIGGQPPEPSVPLGAFSGVAGTEDTEHLSEILTENEREEPQTPLSRNLVTTIARSASRAIRSVFGGDNAPIPENAEEELEATLKAEPQANDEHDAQETPRRRSSKKGKGPHENAAGASAKQKREELRKEMDAKGDSDRMCALCHRGKDHEGGGVLLDFGKLDCHRKANTFVHKECAIWAPQVYEDSDCQNGLTNVILEVRRASRIKCAVCNKWGAALGCQVESCPNSYHHPCAQGLADAKLDGENFLFTCPHHNRKKTTGKRALDGGARATASSKRAKKNVGESWRGMPRNWVFVGSNIGGLTKFNAVKLANLSGSRYKEVFEEGVTHVICSVDGRNLVRRTAKYIHGILHGCWIVSPEWVAKCLEKGAYMPEGPFEVAGDWHSDGEVNAARLGRLRKVNGEPRLLEGKQVFLSGTIKKEPDLGMALRAAGATLLSELPPPASVSTLVILHDDAHADGQVEHHGVKSIDVKTFLESVSRHRSIGGN
ncbi:hypothetical protein BSKO_01067 [Bryopsis sp. KO-2023]|nr:hypothetical protein BSKO_01067 [Bryopsis sp. KO-2023]